ncbi:MAG: hypothetical protein PF569_10250 [Candidatus Woesearchaeota archaeon]|jgi:hypothetical protein|nr:hypothetical protein [Candidatus Woesearchaeota archaeon]
MENSKVYGISGKEVESRVAINGHYEKLFDNKIVGSLNREGRVEALIGLEIENSGLLMFLSVPSPKFEIPISVYMFEGVDNVNPKIEYAGLVTNLGYSFSGCENKISSILGNIIESFKFCDTPVDVPLKRVSFDDLSIILNDFITKTSHKSRDVLFNYR